MNTGRSNDAFHLIAALAGVAGPIAFVLIIILSGTLYDGYSHLAQAVSELGAVDSPVQPLQTFNFVILGTALALFTLSFHQRFPGSGRLTAGLLLYFAIFALIGNGVFPCAPGCETDTTSGTLHVLTAITGFTALTVGLFLIGRGMRHHEEWSQWAAYTRVTGYLIVGFWMLWLVVGPAGEVQPSVHGLFQRLMILSVLQWYAVMGIYLLKQPTHETRLAQRTASGRAT